MKKYDAAIIGFGKGGKTLASTLAAQGKTVALVERSENMYGGTCINIGCIPSKSLVNSSALSQKIEGSFEQKALFYKEAIQEKRQVTAMLRQKNYDKLNNNKNVTIIDGTASFADSHTLNIHRKEDTKKIQAESIFINTGARPFIPPIAGIKESKHVYISETLLDLDILPKQLLIIGGGYIGMEFASIYTNFGSKVTVIQDGSVFLPHEDREIADEVLKSLKERGVKVIFSAIVESIADEQNTTVVTWKEGEQTNKISVNAVLVAAGRRPNVEDLQLENAGVALTSRGAVQTDETLRTTAPNIWAMGDVVGGLQFTYISLDDFRIVKSQLLSDKKRTTENRGAIPYSVFLDPPFSRVGLSEKEALEKGYEIKIAKLSAAAVPKAQILKKTAGLLKAVIDAKTDKILGIHLFCAESHEMINIVKIAIDAGLPYTVLRDSIYTHPTMSEALNDLFASI